MANVYSPQHGYAGGLPFNPSRCSASVVNDVGWRSHQCVRKATVREDGHGWCKQHAPSAEKARTEAADRAYREKMERQPAVVASRLSLRVKALEEAIDAYENDLITLARLLAIRRHAE